MTGRRHNEAEQQREQRRAAAEQDRSRLAALIDRHVSEANWLSLLHRAHQAAEAGQKEIMLLRFPSLLCRDGGRAVNMASHDWPQTLRGEPAELYLRWERELRPQGFHVAARMLDFPGGVPGDVGLYLIWAQ